MSLQLDLFAVPTPPPRIPRTEAEEALAWERRLLTDMLAAPVVACFPGFTGAICERLVEKGLAVSEPAGFLDPEACVADEIGATRSFKAHVREYWKDPHPQFRYSITAAGCTYLPET